MKNIPEPDKKLAADLRGLVMELLSLRDGLYCCRPGCSCDEYHLCAHHAEIYNNLERARVALELAIDNAEREE